MLNFENNIEFSRDFISVLEVENKKLFSLIVLSLLGLLPEEVREPFLLTQEGKDVKISSHMFFISDIFTFNLNDKKIQSLVIEKLLNISTSDESIERGLAKLNNMMFSEISILLQELNAEYTLSPEWNLSKYLKAFDFCVDTGNTMDLLDKVLNFFQVATDVFDNKIICFVNLKSYFTEQEIQEIYKFIIYNKLNVFLLESTKNNKLKFEHKLLIDNEFEEFVVI